MRRTLTGSTLDGIFISFSSLACRRANATRRRRVSARPVTSPHTLSPNNMLMIRLSYIDIIYDVQGLALIFSFVMPKVKLCLAPSRPACFTPAFKALILRYYAFIWHNIFMHWRCIAFLRWVAQCLYFAHAEARVHFIFKIFHIISFLVFVSWVFEIFRWACKSRLVSDGYR